MTKQELIELIQERLASGDVPNDIMGRYKYNAIAGMLAVVYQEAATADINVLSTMVIPYSVDVNCESGKYFSNLPVTPAYGPMSVKYAQTECGVMMYSRQSDDQNVFLNKIKHMAGVEFYVRGSKVLWTKKPKTDIVDVYLIPEFIQMDDDQEVVIPSAISAILTRVIELIRSTDTRPEENINNTSEDNTPKQTNYAAK
jgi:hypothetical protein